MPAAVYSPATTALRGTAQQAGGLKKGIPPTCLRGIIEMISAADPREANPSGAASADGDDEQMAANTQLDEAMVCGRS